LTGYAGRLAEMLAAPLSLWLRGRFIAERGAGSLFEVMVAETPQHQLFN